MLTSSEPALNLYYPTKVLTHRGNLEISDVLPGDFVFEYGTNNLLKVIGVSTPKQACIYKIPYSDGRSQIVSDNRYIYNGNEIIPLRSIDNYDVYNIKQYQINFSTKVHKPLDPTPYTAAPFLIYGDYNDEYMNLPDWLNGISNAFNYNYSSRYESMRYSNKIYFVYRKNYKTQKIKWEQFFPDRVIGITSKSISPIIIPDEYMRASIKDRIKFIRGIFDMGYSPKLFPDNKVGIVHYDLNRLATVQEMLWSLGVLSKISYDPNISANTKNHYTLEIVGEYKGYPGFTYVLEHIEQLLDADNKIIDYQYQFPLTILKNEINKHYAIGFMSNLILEKPKALYIDDNYLPRVSI